MRKRDVDRERKEGGIQESVTDIRGKVMIKEGKMVKIW